MNMTSIAIRNFSRRAVRKRRGTTAIEFSLVLPIALLFFFSLVTFVQAFVIRNAAENAAYFSARKGIIPGTTEAEIRNLITEEMRLGFISNFEANINRSGDTVQVTVTVPFKGNAWATGGYVPDILHITQSCILKKQED
jgi:hypothetical protein